MRNHRKQRGFTLIEVLLTMSIIGLLSSVVLANLKQARDKARFAKAFQQMDAMGAAAFINYSSSGSWWPDVTPDVAPSGFVASYGPWPKPPCPGWYYDWENWEGPAGSPHHTSDGKLTVGVTLRTNKPNKPNAIGILFYCIYTEGTCAKDIGSPGTPRNMRTTTNKTLTCKEQS